MNTAIMRKNFNAPHAETQLNTTITPVSASTISARTAVRRWMRCSDENCRRMPIHYTLWMVQQAKHAVRSKIEEKIERIGEILKESK